MSREAGDPEQEADDEIRAGGAPEVHSDPSHERRHPKRPENDADGAAEGADAEATENCGREPEPLPQPRLHGAQREVDPAPDEDGRDRGEEQALRDVIGEHGAGDRTGDRRRRHPGDDAPVDAAFTSVAERACAGRGRGDGDIRSGGRKRATRERDDQRQSQRPEHEPQHRADVPGDERPDES